MTEFNIFCYAEEYNDEDSFQQKRYRAFNKEVGEKRYYEIRDLIKYDILKDLKLELNKNSWKEEWEKVSKEQWQRILDITEADKEVIENIIGFELDLEEEIIEIDGKKWSKSTIKEALKNAGTINKNNQGTMKNKIKEVIRNQEKEFKLLENHLICLAEIQKEEIKEGNKRESRMTWKNMMDAIESHLKNSNQELIKAIIEEAEKLKGGVNCYECGSDSYDKALEDIKNLLEDIINKNK